MDENAIERMRERIEQIVDETIHSFHPGVYGPIGMDDDEDHDNVRANLTQLGFKPAEVKSMMKILVEASKVRSRIAAKEEARAKTFQPKVKEIEALQDDYLDQLYLNEFTSNPIPLLRAELDRIISGKPKEEEEG